MSTLSAKTRSSAASASSSVCATARAGAQRLDAAALDDAAPGDHQRLARQHPPDAGEDGVAAGGELQLQQLVARLAHQLGRDEAARNQAFGLRREGEALRGLDVIERLDAERIARQDEPPRRRIVQRQRIHAAQPAGEIEPVAAIEMQRQLAIRLGRERRVRQRRPQLDVIVDLGIGDERRTAGLVERLVAGREIDDGEPRLHHADIARAIMPGAVGPAMKERRLHRLEDGGGGRLAALRHHAGDAAHQRRTVAKNSR